MDNTSALDFLSEVYSNLKATEVVYKKYLSEGQTYFHAKSLKTHNLKIKTLLQKHNELLSSSLRGDCKLLVAHYSAWLKKWDELDRSLNPSPEDEFVFENSHSFPKNACKNIENEYLRLKKDVE